MRPLEKGAAAKERRRSGAKSVSGVALASAVAAIAGIVILIIASHSLSKEDNSEFLSFWAALFFMYGIVGGVQTESTRSASHSAVNLQQGREHVFPKLITVGAFSGGVLALLVLAASPFLVTHVFSLNSTIIVTGLILTAALYSCHCVLAGVLQGSGEWRLYSRFLMLEALLRLATVGTAAALALGLPGLEIACLIALAAWLILLASSGTARRAMNVRADAPLPAMLKQTFHNIVSSVSSAALIVAFPLLIKVTSPASVFEQSAPLLLAISMTRAPIMVPLQAFQGFAIAQVAKAGSQGWRALQMPMLLLLCVGSAGAALAYFVGPTLMLLFGSGYKVSALTLALLTLAAAIMAMLTLTGTAALATGRHRAFSSGWAIAAIVAFGALLLPLPLEIRCIVSLTFGPLVGISVHVASLSRSGKQRTAMK
ncbi:hypothetical protein FHJ30_13050 [Arthrobacter sp. BB-1]|uniref:hypothetical protein n=1 Tax=unclassified Arthrobacter TaxID=235627 RepID=UPI0010E021AE|nr:MULTISPECIES: hypothetical protein [unclassified Arthrobacter]TNB71607.1 hypothetical protein FHJ30_13050 [Arthrobacter sp. BB-1]VII96917.1 hypothetical protein [Arthrobacter sp. DR-2P]